VHPLSISELLVCVGVSALMFVWIELEKLVIKVWRSNRKA
jgi:Ca2+-transporting ATPase